MEAHNRRFVKAMQIAPGPIPLLDLSATPDQRRALSCFCSRC
jgi:hypothetical protein